MIEVIGLFSLNTIVCLVLYIVAEKIADFWLKFDDKIRGYYTKVSREKGFFYPNKLSKDKVIFTVKCSAVINFIGITAIVLIRAMV